MLKRGMPPHHPGEILRMLYMEPMGLSQTYVAKHLGVSRKTLSMLLNGHQGMSAEMALRLSKALKTTPGVWLNLQNTYDLWNAGKRIDLSKIKYFRAAKNITPPIEDRSTKPARRAARH
jgi:addiction module HigA family antidote